MFKKLSDKFSKGIIYLAAFLVTALMAVMMIHIVKESIPAISQLGIKMFLPTTEWRPVSQKPQYGLLPAIAGTLYVSAIAVVLALIFGIACACFLDYYLPKKVHPYSLRSSIWLQESRPSSSDLSDLQFL